MKNHTTRNTSQVTMAGLPKQRNHIASVSKIRNHVIWAGLSSCSPPEEGTRSMRLPNFPQLSVTLFIGWVKGAVVMNMIIPQQCKPGVCGITLNVYTRTSTISLMGIYNLLGHSQSLSLEQSFDISVFVISVLVQTASCVVTQVITTHSLCWDIVNTSLLLTSGTFPIKHL